MCVISPAFSSRRTPPVNHCLCAQFWKVHQDICRCGLLPRQWPLLYLPSLLLGFPAESSFSSSVWDLLIHTLWHPGFRHGIFPLPDRSLCHCIPTVTFLFSLGDTAQPTGKALTGSSMKLRLQWLLPFGICSVPPALVSSLPQATQSKYELRFLLCTRGHLGSPVYMPSGSSTPIASASAAANCMLSIWPSNGQCGEH